MNKTNLEVINYLNNPARTYADGVAILQRLCKKWALNPYFKKEYTGDKLRMATAKLEYELGKLVPAELLVEQPWGTNVSVNQAPITEPEVKVEETKILTTLPVTNGEKAKYNENQQKALTLYVDAKEKAAFLHEKLKLAKKDKEREQIATELTEVDQTQAVLFSFVERLASRTVDELRTELTATVADIENQLADGKLKGFAITKRKNSLANAQRELAGFKAIYG